MKYRVYFKVTAGGPCVDVEADNRVDAEQKAYEVVHVSVCHQCSDCVQDPEAEAIGIGEVDADGNVTNSAAVGS